jgi:hypothetical protein
VATMRATVGGDTPNIRAICAAVVLPEMTASAISRRLMSSRFLCRPPMRPSARAAGQPCHRSVPCVLVIDSCRIHLLGVQGASDCSKRPPSTMGHSMGFYQGERKRM